MTNLIVSDSDVQTSKQWLFDNASNIGQAKAEVARTEIMMKSTEALIFAESEGTVKDRESKAKTDDRYRIAALAHVKAVEEFHTLMATQKAHENNISIYQTQSANLRGLR